MSISPRVLSTEAQASDIALQAFAAALVTHLRASGGEDAVRRLQIDMEGHIMRLVDTAAGEQAMTDDERLILHAAAGYVLVRIFYPKGIAAGESP